MALDFSKLTAVVKSVADLAASHASLSALAADAKAVEAKVRDEFKGVVAEIEAKAQGELDTIVAAIEAALGHVTPVTHAEAVGLTAVAAALTGDAPVSPTEPTVAHEEPAAPAEVPQVAVAVAPTTPSIADTIAAVLAAQRPAS